MFRGATKVTLDAKGRLAIPSRYRDRLLARSEGQVVATVDRSFCLLIYPLPDWEEIERKLNRLPAMNKTTRQLQQFMVGYATDLELDSNGRILLPPALRDFAELQKQAMLIGQGNKFELWDEERWNARLEAWRGHDEQEEGNLPPEFQQLSL